MAHHGPVHALHVHDAQFLKTCGFGTQGTSRGKIRSRLLSGNMGGYGSGRRLLEGHVDSPEVAEGHCQHRRHPVLHGLRRAGG